MELKEFDLNKVLTLANKQNQNNSQVINKKSEISTKTNKDDKSNSFDLAKILNKVNTSNNPTNSKTADILRKAVSNYTNNKFQLDNKAFTSDNLEDVKFNINLFLDSATNLNHINFIEKEAKKYYNGYRNTLQKRFNNASNAINELNKSSIIQQYKDCADEVEFYDSHKNEMLNETNDNRLKFLLKSISKSTNLSTINGLIDNFNLYSNNAVDILNRKPSMLGIKNALDKLPDTDEDNPEYNKTDFINNLSPETLNFFTKRDYLDKKSLNDKDLSIFDTLVNYKNARDFIENNEDYKSTLEKIKKYNILKNNLQIENKNLINTFLEIEKMLHRKKKEFRLPDTSAMIIPRKQK